MAIAPGGPPRSATDDPRARARYRRILRFAARYLAENWWFELVLPRFGLARLAARGRTRRWRRTARNFAALAAELGGLMIKVGQFLSARLDVLPPEVTAELAGLQDAVAPEDFGRLRALAEAELGGALGREFASFDEVPIAAASLGQVHRARLHPADAAETGFADAVVKIQRPGIRTIVEVDLAALRRVAGWLSRVRLVSRRVDMPALAEEFAHSSLEEIDYLHEAGNAERFAQQFADDARVKVPGIAWELTTERVLTLEDVTAIKISDTDALRAVGIDPSEVATDFADVMLDQLFVHGFFHGDVHPGNLFVTPLETGAAPPAAGPEDARRWLLTFVDFGMMGEIPAGLRSGLQDFLVAVAARDGRRLVAALQGLDVLLPTADIPELERTMTALFDRFAGVPFTELQDIDPRELRAFADEFGATIRALPFQLPENFLLVIRAVSLTSGLASTLDPAFNIWNAVEPYADRLLRDERGGAIRAIARDLLQTAGVATRLPRRLDALADRLERGELAVRIPALERDVRGVERAVGRVASALVFGALLFAGVFLRATDAVLGVVLMSASALPLLHVVASSWRSRDRP